MDIKGIIAISGKPGLFKVAAQGRNNIIVESLDTGKKFPAFATDKISALEDICIYTHEEDVPLVDVYSKLAEKEGYKASISHKESPAALREHIQTYLPDYDKDRVYDQDLRKLYQWYNILVEKGMVVKTVKAKEDKKTEAKTEKKPAATKTTKKKTTSAAPKSKMKASSAKATINRTPQKRGS